jgi:hypothetical protein
MGNARKRMRPQGAVVSMAIRGAEFMVEPMCACAVGPVSKRDRLDGVLDHRLLIQNVAPFVPLPQT